jgi:sulfur carrier protein
MMVSVNGDRVDLEPPCSLEDLLERFRLAESPCAVEVNRTLVPRRDHAGHVLRDGDEVEIVTLVGGG